MQNLFKAALLGALAASTRVSSTDRDGAADVSTLMSQLATESALTAHINNPTADAELDGLVLVQMEDYRDRLRAELLLAHGDSTSMGKGMLLAQIKAEESASCATDDDDSDAYHCYKCKELQKDLYEK